MVVEEIRVFARELRRQAEGLPLGEHRVRHNAERVTTLAGAAELIDKVQAGRLRRTAARLMGAAVTVPFRSPAATVLRDAAGELDAVVVALAVRIRRGAPGDAA